MYKFCIILVVFLMSPGTKGARPGSFFWKPRLGIYLGNDTEASERDAKRHSPIHVNLSTGLVVLIDGYHVGTTVLAIVAGYYATTKPFVHLHPLSAHYHTNVYRWALRYLTLLPEWLGRGGSYADTHKVWRRRYYYMDDFIPKWMRFLFPWVKKSDWEKEENEHKLFLRYAKNAFGKHNRYPGKKFNGFKSVISNETPERLDAS